MDCLTLHRSIEIPSQYFGPGVAAARAQLQKPASFSKRDIKTFTDYIWIQKLILLIVLWAFLGLYSHVLMLSSCIN